MRLLFLLKSGLVTCTNVHQASLPAAATVVYRNTRMEYHITAISIASQVTRIYRSLVESRVPTPKKMHYSAHHKQD